MTNRNIQTTKVQKNTTPIKTLESTSLWYLAAIKGKNISEEQIFSKVEEEIPNNISVVFERACNIQCAHCEYKPEISSHKKSKDSGLSEIVVNLANQLPEKERDIRESDPYIVHCGRILREEHVETLKKIRNTRPDIKLGIIDNGTYIKNEKNLDTLKLDWIDISLDGMEETHNKQRDPIKKQSFATAIYGLKKARNFVNESQNSVNVNMTITNINYADASAVAKYVLTRDKRLADTIHYSFMTPMHSNHFTLEVSREQFKESIYQIQDVQHEYGSEDVFLRIFRLEDLKNLEGVFGKEALKSSLTDKNTEIFTGGITFTIDNLRINFYPVSLWPTETFLIDADGAQRTAFSAPYSLKQLQNNPELTKFTIDKLEPEASLKIQYNKCVTHWRREFGFHFFDKEKEYFSKLFT